MHPYRRTCTYCKRRSQNAEARGPSDPPPCNCLALRQASRHVTQFYDRVLAPTGLRTTQFSVLAKLERIGPMTINALAGALVMDRTTLARNILPLQREGLIAVRPGRADRRSKELHLTEAGIDRLHAARRRWARAQTRFEAVFGNQRTSELRALLQAVSTSEFGHRARRRGGLTPAAGTLAPGNAR
jgi:DNA-binding MarR family transcriptional regulator